MSKKRQLIRPWNYIVNKKNAEWIRRSMKYRINILEGQVRSGKDMTAAVAFVERIKISKESLFLVGAVKSDKAMGIVGQYIIDYCGGLAIKTKYNMAEAIQFIYKGKVNYIVFAGGYNKNSHEFIQGDSYGGIYLTEINLLDSNFISVAMDRVTASSDPFIFGSLNPKGPKHWFYTDYLDIWEKENSKFTNYLNYSHLTMFDNPAMTEEAIERAKAGKDPNSVFYKRNILGFRVDSEGTLYTVRDYNILEESQVNFKDYQRYITVADLGETKSGTVFLVAGLIFNKEEKRLELHILKEYQHLNMSLNEFQRKSGSQYAADYAKFIAECREIFGRVPEKVLYDGSPDFFFDLKKELIKQGLGGLTPKFIPDKSNEEDRIELGQNWLYQGKLRIFKACKTTLEDIRSSVIDDDLYSRQAKIARMSVFSKDKGHSDALDTLDYAMLHYRYEMK